MCIMQVTKRVEKRKKIYLKKYWQSQAWWHKPEMPATQEVEIRRIAVWGQPRQKVSKTPGMVVHA
jgi:hypothetical protein